MVTGEACGGEGIYQDLVIERTRGGTMKCLCNEMAGPDGREMGGCDRVWDGMICAGLAIADGSSAGRQQPLSVRFSVDTQRE